MCCSSHFARPRESNFQWTDDSGRPSIMRKDRSCLPPSDALHPLSPFLHILAGAYPVNGVPFSSELLIRCHPVYKTVARSTKPSNAVELLLFVPVSLQNFRMYCARYEMVVSHRNPISVTYLAGGNSCFGPFRWTLRCSL